MEDHDILCKEVIPTGDASWPMPINLKRLIWNAQKAFSAGQPGEITDLNPVEVADTVKRLSQNILVVAGKDPLSLEAQKNATLLFSALLRSTLASKRVLQEYRLTPQAFHWLAGEIEERFQQSQVSSERVNMRA
eukprot:1642331-Pyramimonas_sp.AAC.2